MPDMKFIKANWGVPKHVKALTTTRAGGVSNGIYAGLNVGNHVGDNASDVQHNRQALKSALQLPSEPVWLNQQHTAKVINKRAHSNESCDGFYTDQLNTVCAIMTADCLPLFITDRAGTEIALLHVGWRGFTAGIIEQGLHQFNSTTDSLIAWAGPAISQQHFEIGADCKQLLGGEGKYYRNSERAGYYYADLYGLVGAYLAAQGVTYRHSNECTYANNLFYSYRREGVTGRMVSLLWLQPGA